MAGKPGSRKKFTMGNGMHSDQINDVVAKNFRLLRRRAKISQAELARMLGVKPQQIWKFEHNVDSLHASQLTAFAGIFNCQEGDFFRGLPQGGSARVTPITKEIAEIRDFAWTSQGLALNELVSRMPGSKRKTVVALAKELAS